MNGLNDALAYALEARYYENFEGMVNKALVLENHRGMMEHKHKLVRQHQPGSCSRPRVATSSARPMFILLSHSFSRSRMQLDKDFPPSSVKEISGPIISRPLLLGIRVFRGLKLLRSRYRVN
jgi:hypothetical protein